MGDKTWKRVEREKCRELGGERSGPTGRDTPDCDDSVHVGLEVKSYKTFVFLTKDWEQAVDNAAKIGKPPVLAVKERGHNGRDMVQITQAYFTILADCADLGPTAWYTLVRGQFVRLPWEDFVRLYRAAYINEKENSTG
jgi:hypothetical protein